MLFKGNNIEVDNCYIVAYFNIGESNISRLDVFTTGVANVRIIYIAKIAYNFEMNLKFYENRRIFIGCICFSNGNILI